MLDDWPTVMSITYPMELVMCSIRRMSCRLMPVVMVALVGCASFSNPTTFPSVPVRRLPDEMLGHPREEQVDLPQALLRQPEPKEHIIDDGDILGVMLDGVLGPKDQPPLVNVPQIGSFSRNIGIGYPIPVLGDGTITLPLLKDPVDVRGLTIGQAQERIRSIYLSKQLLIEDQIKLLVTLYRPRQYRVLVVRQDTGNEIAVQGSQYIAGKRGSSFVLDLNVYENDVLTALARSGGLPGNDAKNEVIIQRGNPKEPPTTMPNGPIPGLETIHIPLRLRPGDPIPFKPEDIILKNGDIVFIQSRDTEVFYVGGLITPGEYPIPRNYDLDVLTAVASVHGPLANGGINYNNLQGNIVSQGLGAPSPSQLTVIRRAPGKRQITIRVDLNRALQDPRERILVQPGDFLILQETMGESFTRYMTGAVKFNSFFRILNQQNAQETVTGTFP